MFVLPRDKQAKHSITVIKIGYCDNIPCPMAKISVHCLVPACVYGLGRLAPTERQEKLLGKTCTDSETGEATGGREQLGLEKMYSETRRQKEDGGIKRRDWN